MQHLQSKVFKTLSSCLNYFAKNMTVLSVQGQDEIRQHLGDKLLKQLQQQQRTETQRAQLQQHHQQQQREVGRMQEAQKKAPTKRQEMVEDSSPALAHFNQLQRSRTPPPSVSPKHDSSKPWSRAAPNSPRADRDQPHGRSAPNSPRADRDPPWGRAAPSSPRAETDQAWSRAPSSSPAPEPDQARKRPEPDQARGRPASAGHRDSNNVYNEGHGHQGRAAPNSPGRTQRHAMAPEHMTKDNRQVQLSMVSKLKMRNVASPCKNVCFLHVDGCDVVTKFAA